MLACALSGSGLLQGHVRDGTARPEARSINSRQSVRIAGARIQVIKMTHLRLSSSSRSRSRDESLKAPPMRGVSSPLTSSSASDGSYRMSRAGLRATRPRRSRGRPAERNDGVPVPPKWCLFSDEICTSGVRMARNSSWTASSPGGGGGGGAVREYRIGRERWDSSTRSLWGKITSRRLSDRAFYASTSFSKSLFS